MSLLDKYDRYEVTVVTVCRDSGTRIDTTAASIAGQTGLALEWVVVDGASSDDTVMRIEAWREKLICTLKVESEPDAGIYDAMNKGLRRARGDWVLFLNAGDTLFPGGFEALYKAITPNAVIVTGRVRQYDPSDGYAKDVGERFSLEGVAYGRLPPHQAILYRRSAVLAIGGYDPKLGMAADAAVTLRVAGRGEVLFVSSVVANFPADGVSSRFDWRWRVHRDKARAIRAAAPDWVWRRYRWRWPLEALRATAAHLLRCCGLLGLWRRIKRVAGGRDDDRRGDR